MTSLEDFTKIFERLEVVYGVRNEKTITTYWDRLKRFEPWIIRKAVDRTLDESDAEYFPKLAFLVKTATYIRDREEKPKRKPTYCSKCESGGLVLVRIKEDGKERKIAYRCDCANGDRLSREIASIRDLNGKVALRDPIQNESLPKAEYSELIGDPGKMFKGILIKRCKKCSNPYYVKYEREIRVKDLMDLHERSLQLCDPCYINEGRKRGLWG